MDVIKVLLLTDEAGIGGGQRHILSLARLLNAGRFEVIVGCPTEGYLGDEVRRAGIPHVDISLPAGPSPIAFLRTLAMLRSVRPGILHTHGGTAGFYGRMAALFVQGIRTVHTYHGIHYLNFRKGFRRWLYACIDKMLLRWTNGVICVARSDFEAGTRAGVVPGDASVITNGIDVDEFRPLTRVKVRNKKVGTIGRMHVQKGQEYLLEAMRRVIDREPSATLRIVGDGKLMERLRAQAAGLGIAEHTEFAGARTDTAEQLSSMHVFVLPSLWEGFPIVVLEAMAAGKPIVATGVNGVSEILEDGVDSILVPPRDAERLAEGILRLLSSDDLADRLAARALDKVRRSFDVGTMVERTEKLYERALG
ncbi:MAG: glycosyltransferase family 4 protein [Ignavibacterium sp.]